MDYKFGEYCLHTHSHYCGHGIGTIKEYIDSAIDSKIKLIGFSEHCPVKENRWAKSRMPYEKIETYLDDIQMQKESFEEKGEDIKILKGFECDYYKEYKSYLEEMKERVDYLIMGVHYLQLPSERDFALHNHQMGKKELFLYCNEYISAMESGLFSFAAHPDLFAIQYHHWDKETIAISKEILDCATYYDIPLEVNGNGLIRGKIFADGKWRDPYPIIDFWKIAQNYSNLKVVGTPDAHLPLNISKFKKNCEDFIEPLSLSFSSCSLDKDNLLSFNN